MHDHGQIYSGIEGASPGRFAALVTKHEVVTLGKLGEERAQALGRAPVAAMSGFQIAVVHDCPERVDSAGRTALPMVGEREGRRCAIVKRATLDAALGSR